MMLRKLITSMVLKQYHKWYYNNYVWGSTTFMGASCKKSVSDMWNYQEILYELKPSLIVEFGTSEGGSALYFSSILKHINETSKVLTVDIDHSNLPESVKSCNHIELLTCSSSDHIVKTRISELREEYPGKAFFILDSDHSMTHVLSEMELLRSIVVSGDYVIVEDSNINGHPVRPNWGDGPYEAITEYFKRYPDDYVHDDYREAKFGFTFAPKGFLIRK